jgi:hypothetical protein
LTVAAPPVTNRALNRATLARQLLLEPSDLDPTRAVEHVAGLQAQTPQSWYVGLWSRLRSFDPLSFSALLADRRVVRMALMRGTIHLVSAADAWRFRRIIQPVLDRQLHSSFHRQLDGLDPDAVARHGEAFMAARPRTFSELGAHLHETWPDRDRLALEMAVRARIPLVQVPPRGLWGRSGRVMHTTIGAWLGPPPRESWPVEELVVRYLGAFGPASVPDIATWSGLAGVAAIVERMRSRLVSMQNQRGRELFDLPDAPRPDSEVPAPVRYLYDYDNLFLSHADRSRMQPPDPYRTIELRPNEVASGFLVDGVLGGLWRLERRRSTVRLDLRPIVHLGPAVRRELEREGERLLGFLAPAVSDRDIRIELGEP